MTLFATLFAQVILILAAARLAGWLAKPLGQPRVVGEMAAGIALGPSLLGALAPNLSHALFAPDRLAALGVVSQAGVLMFLFLVGLKLDLSLIRGHAKSALVISHASIVVPFAIGASLAPWLFATAAGPGVHGTGVALLPFALLLGAAMSVTAFPVLARILEERQLLETRMGAIALASAAIDDVTAWCILGGAIAVAQSGNGTAAVMRTVALAVVIVTAVIAAGGRLLRELDRRRVAQGGIFTVLTVACTFALAALSAYATNAIGLHALFGAFLAGTVIPRDNGLARAIVSRLEWGVGTLLLPAFFAFSGLRTDLGLLSAATAWMQFAVVLGAAIVGKLGGAAISARITGSSWHESLGIGILMNTRGLMELVVLNVALELGIFSPTIFSIMVAMALLTTLMTSPLLALLQRVPFAAAARIRA